MVNESLRKFYTEDGQDAENRRHYDILSMTDEELEKTHDFIQWIFPTPNPSAFNPDAPILTPATIEYLKHDAVFQARFSCALRRMFDFWQLPYKRSGKNYLVQPFTKHLWWMEHDNHNLLRMTRVMESCRLLGYEKTGRSLFEALVRTIKEHPEFYFIEPINVYWWYRSISGASI